MAKKQRMYGVHTNEDDDRTEIFFTNNKQQDTTVAQFFAASEIQVEEMERVAAAANLLPEALTLLREIAEHLKSGAALWQGSRIFEPNEDALDVLEKFVDRAEKQS